MKQVFVCSGCMQSFLSQEIAVVPRYSEKMNMVVTAYICPTCLPRILDETEAYLETARDGEPWREGEGLKNNEVIENFVGFLLRHELLDLLVDVRYAPSVEEGIARMRGFLDRIRRGERPLAAPAGRRRNRGMTDTKFFDPVCWNTRKTGSRGPESLADVMERLVRVGGATASQARLGPPAA